MWAAAAGFPVPAHQTSAAPHEVTLVRDALSASFTCEQLRKLIGGRADDSAPLGAQGVKRIATHKRNRVKAKTQDWQKLRRYQRRWKVERLIAWLQNFRRVEKRFDYHAENYLAFVYLGCIRILLRCYL